MKCCTIAKLKERHSGFLREIYQYFCNFANRMGNFKLIRGSAGDQDGWIAPPRDGTQSGSLRQEDGQEVQLFDLSTDPEERVNLADVMPDVVESLLSRLQEIEQLGILPHEEPDV